MTYHYLDASRESDPHALPDVEVFDEYKGRGRFLDPNDPRPPMWWDGKGFYYAPGSPGCLWDSDPVGPYDSESEALTAAREAAGYCAHGVSDEGICEDCPAPELWVLKGPDGNYMARDRFGTPCNDPDPALAGAWQTKQTAASGLEYLLLDLPGRFRGYEPVRLPDADARRWGRGKE